MRVIWILLALTATARAEPRSGAALAWHAPAGCPEIAEVRARIERRLGTPIDERSGIDSAVHGIAVEVVADDAGRGRRFVARIDLGAPGAPGAANEVRVLTSERCDELADAVAVVIARLAAEAHQPVVALRSERVPLAPRAAPAPRAWGGGIRALGISGIGTLPGVSVGGELAGYARHRSAVIELAATRWRRGSAVVQPGASSVEVGMDVLALRIGWRPAQLPLRAWLAAERGAVEGFAQVRGDAGTGRWTAIGAGFGVAWPMSPHARLVGVLELAVPLEPARFLLRADGEMMRPDLLAVRSGLGLELGWQ